MIRKIFALLFIILSAQLHAQINKKLTQSLVRVTTTDDKGTSLGTANGFAIASQDSATAGQMEILSVYSIFPNAVSGSISNGKGNLAQIQRITGGNDLYDVVRFTIDKNSVPPLTIAGNKLSIGSKAFILSLDAKGKPAMQQVSIAETTEHGGITFYTILRPADTSLIGCPLLNESGHVVGVIQRNASSVSDKIFAIGIEFNRALGISTVSAANPELQAIRIPKQLPTGQEQAASYLYLIKNNADTLSYLANLADFIEEFPESYVGYTERAEYFAQTKRYAAADADFTKALQICTNKADIHLAISTLLYNLNLQKDYQQYKDWSLERALNESEQAYSINPSPFYLMQRGKCLYALKRYQEAADTYADINATDFRSAENLVFQSLSLEKAGGDSTQVLALLDSAVAQFPRPLPPAAATYTYLRAQQYNRYGFHKEAALSYQDYEDIVGSKQLNDVFFFNKAETELQARLYPQALNDIEKALALNPGEYVYHIEKALIEMRTGHYEEAVFTATQAQKIDSNDPDSYKIIGISLGELGRKAEARQNLQRAHELGDPQAQEWLNSMK